MFSIEIQDEKRIQKFYFLLFNFLKSLMIIFDSVFCPKKIFKSTRVCLVIFSISNRCEKSKVIMIKISIIKALHINKEIKKKLSHLFKCLVSPTCN